MQTDAGNVEEAQMRGWLEASCPHLWELLNLQARRRLPLGLVAYVAPPSPDDRKQNLLFADGEVAQLIAACGQRKVGDAYCRALSGCNTEAKVAELFCEVAVAAALSRRGRRLELCPASGRGATRYDFAVELGGVRICGEVKRYEDDWLSATNADGGFQVRSLVAAAPGTPTGGTDRPRSMELRGKLLNVPKQLPEGTVNVLFVYHQSLGDNHRYLQAALFGDASYWNSADAVGEPGADGLFARGDWQAISACCLTRVLRAHGFYCEPWWPNPRAKVLLPEAVRRALEDLRHAPGELR